ncbi:MAG: gfo/Idh/MocA family oxidoreductase, partial [Acidobacteriota bacterium]
MINRRDFVARSAGAVASASTLSGLNGGFSILAGRPNDTIRVAVVGVRGQGNAHIREYLRMPNVEIAALCDIDPSELNRRLGEIEKASGKRP